MRAQVIAWAALAVSLAACERWLKDADADADLFPLLGSAFDILGATSAPKGADPRRR